MAMRNYKNNSEIRGYMTNRKIPIDKIFYLLAFICYLSGYLLLYTNIPSRIESYFIFYITGILLSIFGLYWGVRKK
ncbi:MAG: hypothetical protein QIT40_gp15 [Lokiarchaeia virus VerdaV4]|uniref:Transmembrane protein n=1 Tax=Lokiarchaeia virus VerdaV4 TaxID=3070172 RepID=A0AA35CQZ7_9CAUD|nr:MAG: hypothetical protein QIT40_gp15 [Lokiarchaeia virus VerdaV4]BDI54973.1 MAG: hypothetical protein [Lokiarchaeia virus VerdaV4]